MSSLPQRATRIGHAISLWLPVGPVCEVLALLGLLDDDRDAQGAWIAVQLSGLPGQIRDEAAAWFGELRDGGRRSRPRAEGTPRRNLHAHPVLGRLPGMLRL